MIDAGESPDVALRREVEEETGYRVRDLRHIGTFYVSPGGTSERIVLYYTPVSNADHDGKGGGVASEGEDIKVVSMTPAEAAAAVTSGQIQDAKTLIGLMWFNNQFSQEGAP
jgi:ADP-ribose pyrophosphatase